MLGALGAVTAAAPAEVVVQAIGWRGLFAALAGTGSAADPACGTGSSSGPTRAAGQDESCKLASDLPRPGISGHCPPLCRRHRHVLVAARPLGRALAARRRWSRSRKRGAAPRHHGGRGLPERAVARHGCGSATSPRHQDGIASGGDHDGVNCGADGTRVPVAHRVVPAVDGDRILPGLRPS